MEVNLPQRRSKRIGGENWAQFELRDPETEAAELSELEASAGLKRGWNLDGAANVYFRVKSPRSRRPGPRSASSFPAPPLGARCMPQDMRGARPIRLLPSLPSNRPASARYACLAALGAANRQSSRV